jgi:hypothetical protein
MNTISSEERKSFQWHSTKFADNTSLYNGEDEGIAIDMDWIESAVVDSLSSAKGGWSIKYVEVSFNSIHIYIMCCNWCDVRSVVRPKEHHFRNTTL